MSLGEPSEGEGTENRMTHHRPGGLGRRIGEDKDEGRGHRVIREPNWGRSGPTTTNDRDVKCDLSTGSSADWSGVDLVVCFRQQGANRVDTPPFQSPVTQTRRQHDSVPDGGAATYRGATTTVPEAGIGTTAFCCCACCTNTTGSP